MSRMDAIQAPIVQVVGDLIREVPGTISLGQGVVHFGPPPAAVAAAQAAISNPATHEYQDGFGTRALIGAIEEKLARDNGIDVALPSTAHGAGLSGVERRGTRVMVTAGGNMAFVHAILAITRPGDEVILPVPFYFNHEMAIQMAGCTPVRVPTDDRYQLDVDAVRRAVTPRTRAVVTVSPNNPTGAVYAEPALRAISQICADHGLIHLSDEVYEYFTYGSARHVSPGSFTGAQAYTVSMYSLSKAYGLAGWRLGYMAFPERLTDAIAKVQDTVLVCPPVISQIIGLAAMEVGPSWCRRHLDELREVRDLVIAELGSLEPLCSVAPVDGAFYCFVRVNAAVDPMRLAERLVREHRVAVIPGPAFGALDDCSFRVAFGAQKKETVAEGISRLVHGLRTLLG
jgi:aspartate/methionine/tyrosine aminotransferase